jgi:hypothetical protein
LRNIDWKIENNCYRIKRKKENNYSIIFLLKTNTVKTTKKKKTEKIYLDKSKPLTRYSPVPFGLERIPIRIGSEEN